ncbi:hypothetical protein [Algoriphagus namhaensis]
MNDKILGFELIHHDEIVFAGFDEVSLSLVFAKNPGVEPRKLEVTLSGLNLGKDEFVEWLNLEIKAGDEFVLKVKDSDTISPYRIKEKPIPSTEVLAKMSKEEKLQMKLRQFRYLEKKLKFKGLI